MVVPQLLRWYKKFKYPVFIRTEKYIAYSFKEVSIFIFKKVH